ncbi:MAG: exodeoxyribonuclease-1 [Halieaceae bacterium]
MSSSESFYWHDYETFGADPSRDRPVQFAGLRTDLDLNPVGDPLELYALPARDYLPQPAACLITGITPQLAQEKGVAEAAFMASIHAELAQPGTCGVGYNSLRFDDEVTRYALYRNLYDPYAREYQHANSRWDLIDAVRTAYVLRPQGINWPRRDDGLPSFRLEDLTRANGIEHGQAHDALADVRATIAMAGLLRDRQPKLYTHLFALRRKPALKQLVDPEAMRPLLHVSGMFGGARANLGLILPLFWHPQNRNQLICYDLSVDPVPLFEQPAERLRELLYTPAAALPENTQRPGLKSVHINRCPVLLTPKMLDETVAQRASLDRESCRGHLRLLRDYQQRFPGALRDKLRQLYAPHQGIESGSQGQADSAGSDPSSKRPADPDRQLYGGGFSSDADRATLDRVRVLSPVDLATLHVAFDDERLGEMLFRYRARNFPETLDSAERERWESFRFHRLSEGGEEGYLDLESYQTELATRLSDPALTARDRSILEALEHWGDSLLA